MNVAARTEAIERVLQRMSARVRSVLALIGSAFLVVGCIAAPGRGGARLFALPLAAVCLLLPWPIGGRRRAGLFGCAGTIAIVGGNIAAVAGDLGLGTIPWGGWLALAGSLALGASFVALPPDGVRPRLEWRATGVPGAALEISLVLALAGVALASIVIGLDMPESHRFLSFAALLAVSVAVGSAVGVADWLRAAIERRRVVALSAVSAAAVAFPFTQGGSGYWVRVFASIGVFAAAAIGLNVVVGLAGLLDLGYVAFFGVGAYTGALLGGAQLSTNDIELPFVVVLVIGAAVSAGVGVIIGAPTLRLRGDYLAIVTLGFGEIFRITANNWDGLTRGPNGIAQIPDLAVGGFDFGAAHNVAGIELAGFANYYFAEILLVAACILVFRRLNDSRIGRAWVAIREDETAAAAMGVNTVRMKLLAFAIGATLAGAAGTLQAHVTSQVSPDSFTFLESILLLSAVVLGGMGTVPGALLGATVLFVVPEKLRSFQDKRLLLFGIALVLLMRFRPEGIVASKRRQREFHEVDPTLAAQAVPPV